MLERPFFPNSVALYPQKVSNTRSQHFYFQNSLLVESIWKTTLRGNALQQMWHLLAAKHFWHDDSKARLNSHSLENFIGFWSPWPKCFTYDWPKTHSVLPKGLLCGFLRTISSAVALTEAVWGPLKKRMVICFDSRCWRWMIIYQPLSPAYWDYYSGRQHNLCWQPLYESHLT